eukprot:scaffold254694_cov17-Prasinocladus_malaysianus.AAC.1
MYRRSACLALSWCRQHQSRGAASSRRHGGSDRHSQPRPKKFSLFLVAIQLKVQYCDFETQLSQRALRLCVDCIAASPPK